MATVWLERRDWEKGDVPDVCMTCGGDAPDRVKKKMTWMPSWVIVVIVLSPLIGVIVALCVRQKRRTLLPLCEEHKNHWRWRTMFAWASFGAALAVGVLLATAISFLANPGEEGGMIAFTLLLTFLVWLVPVAIVQARAIKPLEFSKGGIRLTNVSPRFVEAYEDEIDREEKLRYADKDLIDRTVRDRWNQGARRPIADETRKQIREEAPGDEGRPNRDKYRPE